MGETKVRIFDCFVNFIYFCSRSYSSYGSRWWTDWIHQYQSKWSKTIKFVPVSELKFQNELTHGSKRLSNLILLTEWIEDFKLSSSSDKTAISLKLKYSNEPITKLLNFLPEPPPTQSNNCKMLIEEPLDLIRLALDELIYIKWKVNELTRKIARKKRIINRVYN